MTKAFLLGAGLGTRLRPLTDRLPKPLIPLFHRPMIAWALDACTHAGIRDFAINTHHIPEAWQSEAGGLGVSDWKPSSLCGTNGLHAMQGTWQGHSIHLFHEPDLLETGGGIQNISPWIGNESILIHNGDIFSTIDLPKLIAAHTASGLPATLAVRSDGPARHIALNNDGVRATDIRNLLGNAEGTHQFTGIYCISPEILTLIPPHEKISVIPAFLELAKQGRLGTVVLDEGHWLDLGDPDSYLEAHQTLGLAEAISPKSEIAGDAIILNSAIGPRATVGPKARVEQSVVWPGARVEPGTSHLRTIVM